MKKLIVIILLLLPSIGYSFDNAVWLSISPSKTKPNFSIGIRGKEWGGELGLVNDFDFSTDNILDYKMPHSDYTNLGWQNVDQAYGIDIYRYFNVNSNSSVYIGPGFYMREQRLLAKSNLTDLVYTQATSEKIQIPISIGFDIYGKEFFYGLGYHSMRGLNIQFGIVY